MEFFIFLSLDPYLAQWFVHGLGGVLPVRLPKGSAEAKHLEMFLQKWPAGLVPPSGEGMVKIVIPYFRHKPPGVYNYLPQHATAALVSIIRRRFDLELWEGLHHIGAIGKQQKELIYSWMEAHGIECTGTNWDAVAKRYRRCRNHYLNNERSKKAYKSKKSF